MARFCFITLVLALLSGCGDRVTHMQLPEDPDGRYREQIAVAKRLLQQREDWANRAEWEVQENSDGWKVVAWRIEHPESKGASRYLPWGCSIIELDHRMVAVHYEHKG